MGEGYPRGENHCGVDDALGTYIKAETAKYAKMISEAGIKLD